MDKKEKTCGVPGPRIRTAEYGRTHHPGHVGEGIFSAAMDCSILSVNRVADKILGKRRYGLIGSLQMD